MVRIQLNCFLMLFIEHIHTLKFPQYYFLSFEMSQRAWHRSEQHFLKFVHEFFSFISFAEFVLFQLIIKYVYGHNANEEKYDMYCHFFRQNKPLLLTFFHSWFLEHFLAHSLLSQQYVEQTAAAPDGTYATHLLSAKDCKMIRNCQ